MREKILTTIADHFHCRYDLLYCGDGKIDAYVWGRLSLGNIADAVVKALANEEITTECAK